MGVKGLKHNNYNNQRATTTTTIKLRTYNQHV